MRMGSEATIVTGTDVREGRVRELALAGELLLSA